MGWVRLCAALLQPDLLGGASMWCRAVWGGPHGRVDGVATTQTEECVCVRARVRASWHSPDMGPRGRSALFDRLTSAATMHPIISVAYGILSLHPSFPHPQRTGPTWGRLPSVGHPPETWGRPATLTGRPMAGHPLPTGLMTGIGTGGLPRAAGTRGACSLLRQCSLQERAEHAQPRLDDWWRCYDSAACKSAQPCLNDGPGMAVVVWLGWALLLC